MRNYFLALLAGILAGVLGIGCGMITGPILLQLGTNPLISTASTTVMVFITSLSSFVQYAILGKIQYDYAVVLMCCGVIAAITGKSIKDKIVRTGNVS